MTTPPAREQDPERRSIRQDVYADRGFTVLQGSRAPGTSRRDIMARNGHGNPRAALIYQHANQEADQGIAASMDEKVRAARRKPSKRNQRRPAASNEKKR